MAFESRLAVIAGGAGGIGRASGKNLHAQGANIAILYAPFEADTVQKTISETYQDSSKVKAYECDITSPESVDKAFAAIKEDGVAIPSILINAAGYVNLTNLEETPPEDFLKHYMVNLYGPSLVSQAFAKAYLAAKEQGEVPPGRIVTLASQAAHVALHRHGAYCASKAALIGLTKCMASEWGPKGITANTVSPGPVWTELGKKAWADDKAREHYLKGVPSGKFAEPEEVARIVEFLCRDESLNINGDDIKLEGGYCAR